MRQAEIVIDVIQGRSCTSTLRIIPSAREAGKISPFHHRARGFCHDSTPFFLPVGVLGTPVAVLHVVYGLAQCRCAPRDQRPVKLSQPPRKCSNESTPFPGLPHKPHCALCEQKATK